MKRILLAGALALALEGLSFGALAADGDAKPEPNRPARAAKPFVVYDHIHQRNTPDLKPFGLVPIELCYNTKTKEKCQASVSNKFEKTGGPIVFDIEKTNRNDHEVTTQHLKEVAKWAHEAAPDCKIGFYAVGPSNLTPLNKNIAKFVDAFFPSMYFHNTNRRAWANTARKLVTQGHREHKPVYLFLMPKFHGSEGGEVPRSFWKFQLETARKVGADGVVIWASKAEKWSDKSPWWLATKNFMEELKKPAPAPQAAALAQPATPPEDAKPAKQNFKPGRKSK